LKKRFKVVSKWEKKAERKNIWGEWATNSLGRLGESLKRKGGWGMCKFYGIGGKWIKNHRRRRKGPLISLRAVNRCDEHKEEKFWALSGVVGGRGCCVGFDVLIVAVMTIGGTLSVLDGPEPESGEKTGDWGSGRGGEHFQTEDLEWEISKRI